MRAWHALEDHELPTQLTTNPFFLKKSACTPKPVLMENIQSGTDFGAKLASSKDAVIKHSLPIKIPSPRVVLLQDPCLLKGFKELILCRGCFQNLTGTRVAGGIMQSLGWMAAPSGQH